MQLMNNIPGEKRMYENLDRTNYILNEKKVEIA